jgi:Xaa-Pro aminopeptidase
MLHPVGTGTVTNRLKFFVACTLLIAGNALALESVPKAEYRQRRVALSEKLEGGAALVFAAEELTTDFVPYRQDSDFYYLSGWNEPGAALLVIGPGPAATSILGDLIPAHTYREILFLPARNMYLEQFTGIKMDATTPGVAGATGFDTVMPMTALPEVLTSFLAEDPLSHTGLSPDQHRHVWSQMDLPAAKGTIAFLSAALGNAAPLPESDVRTLIRDLRSVKSPAEIELIRKATNASMAAQRAGMRAIEPGVRERTIAGVEIKEMMAEGCERPSYAPVVGSGINSTTLHYSSNESAMKSGDLVLIDAAGEFSMYASDITRTMPVNGKFTARQKEIYEIVLGAQKAAAAAFVAGKSKRGSRLQRSQDVTDSLDKVAFDYINTHGKDLHGEPLGKYFLHILGHSVGIDVHDPMDYTKPLDRGMVFTIEPGIYIPEEKIGVRIEDVYYVDSDGKLVDLVEGLPHEATDVEAAMRRSIP